MDILIKKLKLNKKCVECVECKFKCNAIYFQQNFKSWTSGNKLIDKFIQDIQLSAHDDAGKILEWIPYNRFRDIEYIMKKKVYRANWIDGSIMYWDKKNKNWMRYGNTIVILKNFNNSNDITTTLELTNMVY
jgi:hypothetical protein